MDKSGKSQEMEYYAAMEMSEPLPHAAARWSLIKSNVEEDKSDRKQ